MSVPEPNSPEARRAAQKVRNVFFFIAAANLVIIAIVLWPPGKPGLGVAPVAEVQADTLQAMETVLDRVLEAYHSRDAERFAQEFSERASPRVDEEYFRVTIVGRIHEEFGGLKKISREEARVDADSGLLVYHVETTKASQAKLTAKFTREDESLKLVNWKLERL